MSKVPKDVLIIFFLLALTYGYFYQDPSWNGNSRLGLTLAMVQEGRLVIDSFHQNKDADLETGDEAFYNGHYYTDKAIGSSLLAAVPYAPIYWISRWLGLAAQPVDNQTSSHLFGNRTALRTGGRADLPGL